MLIRFRPEVVDLKAKVVVILAGTNDIAENTGPMTNEEIQANMMSMAEIGKANGVRVVLSSILPVSAYHTPANGVPQTIQRPMARIRAINDWMKSTRRPRSTCTSTTSPRWSTRRDTCAPSSAATICIRTTTATRSWDRSRTLR